MERPATDTPSNHREEGHLLGSLIVVGIGLLLCVIMGVASWHIHACNKTDFWLDIAVLTFGIACGWLLGTVVSPTVAQESERFLKLSAAVGSFVSGYLLSKVDPLLTSLVKKEAWNTTSSFRLLMWLTGLVLALMTVYALRVYFLPLTDDEIQENRKQATSA
jgi:multisubunit Na+/H+ antiporter MnhB subunit